MERCPLRPPQVHRLGAARRRGDPDDAVVAERVQDVGELRASVRANRTASALVDLEVYNSSGQKVFQRYWDGQSFSANATRTFSAGWRIPSNLPRGTYTVKVGVFGAGWSGMHVWNNSAATFTVR